MMAVELGAAAGFEAWRRYNHRHGVTHGGDREGQVRSLVEMAIYEVDRLWGHGDRHGDSHGKGKALLAAAAIALKYLHKGDHGRHSHGKHHSHRGHSSDSDSSSSSSSSDDGGRGRSFLRHAGEAAAVAGAGKWLRDRTIMVTMVMSTIEVALLTGTTTTTGVLVFSRLPCLPLKLAIGTIAAERIHQADTVRDTIILAETTTITMMIMAMGATTDTIIVEAQA
ncbi:hypothetical protein RhiJN_12318 [Ceratobasidium sp. AG-Ba]|nr:hypothetical protein RhiJN_12318 [Ceratobasidium sp. AG-Ba]